MARCPGCDCGKPEEPTIPYKATVIYNLSKSLQMLANPDRFNGLERKDLLDAAKLLNEYADALSGCN